MLKQTTALRTATPEEEELERKQAQLAELEATLIEQELQFATLQADLAAFEKLNFEQVGRRLVRLDEIEEQIARALAGHAAEPLGPDLQSETAQPHIPTPELKALFRETARALHPDLVIDEDEKRRRTKLMAEANAAYKDGNAVRLEELLRQGRDDPDAIRGTDTAARLIRCIRRIAQVERRLAELVKSLEEVRSSDLFALKSTIEAARRDGRDLLAEMRHTVDERIRFAELKLAQMRPTGDLGGHASA
jgi:hypothetical protein